MTQINLSKCNILSLLGLPSSSTGKESNCNVGDSGSIPGSGRCAGEGIGYPVQYSWASLVAQMVKNLPAMWGNLGSSLGWEDPLEKGKATHSSILAWKIPWTLQSRVFQSFVGYKLVFYFSRMFQTNPMIPHSNCYRQ